MPSFTSIPVIDPTQLTNVQMVVIDALKENVDILTGAKYNGEGAAVTRDMVTVPASNTMSLTAMSATGSGYAINGVNVASAEDVRKLIADVTSLANDVATLYSVLNQLVYDMKGSR